MREDVTGEKIRIKAMCCMVIRFVLFQSVNATCDNINCGNKLCVADSSGRPRCVTCSCNMTDPRKAERGCSENLQPMTLCGTDGKTYKDYSSLRKEMCKIKTFIDVDHLGACKGNRLNTVWI